MKNLSVNEKAMDFYCQKIHTIVVADKIQLTDDVDLLMADEQVGSTLITSKSHDCGLKLGYLQTNFLYASRCENIVGKNQNLRIVSK